MSAVLHVRRMCPQMPQSSLPHRLAVDNDVKVLSRLLDDQPWLVDATDESRPEARRCPLHDGCLCGAIDTVRLLLDRGAAVDVRDSKGMTPLMMACRGGFVELVALLLSRGADPQLTAREGSTAMMYTVVGVKHCETRAHLGHDHVAVARLLLEDGRLSADARNKTGVTALWCACELGLADLARVLVVEGAADHTIGDEDGVTAMTRAEKHGHQDCVELLQVSG